MRLEEYIDEVEVQLNQHPIAKRQLQQKEEQVYSQVSFTFRIIFSMHKYIDKISLLS